MKKINYISALFILAFWAFTVNITAQNLYIEKLDESMTEEFNISEIDYIVFVDAIPEFVRVDAAPINGDWTGEYLVVYEGTSNTSNTNTYAFQSSGDPFTDAGGNSIPVTISDKKIALDGTTYSNRVIIDPITGGGWSIKSPIGYYLGNINGSGASANNLNPTKTFNAVTHKHMISIGPDEAGGTNARPGTYPDCAIIENAGGYFLRFNANGTNLRFAYWPAVPGTINMCPVALYKLQGMGAPFFSVDQTPQTVGWKLTSSTATINVSSNVAWTASVIGAGATITSGASGSGPGTVTVSFTENNTASTRTATVTISTTDPSITTNTFTVTVTQSATGTPDLLPERYVRMIVWAKPYASAPKPSSSDLSEQFPHWMLFQSVAAAANDGSWYNLDKDYYAEDVLDIIDDLKPTCLDRFVTGTGNQSPTMLVPTKQGNPTMTYEQFLQAAINAAAPGCYIVPKLDLVWLAEAKNKPGGALDDETVFWRSARSLYNLNVTPAIRTVCLDCWNNFVTNFPTDQERTAVIQKLKDIGYTEFHVNFTGATGTNNTLVDVAKWNIQANNNWSVNTTALNNFKSWPNIKKYLLYIDYPGAMDKFLTDLTPMPHTPPYGFADQQADILISNIVNRQKSLGFTYVFPFFQNGYDPKTFKTNPTGKYGGKTMYEIQKELLKYGELQ